MSENVQYKYKPSLIDWRRNFVLQRTAQGATQTQIAEELHLHPSTISLDMQFLREKVQKELENHISETIPLRYTQVMEGLRQMLWSTHNIINKENLDDKTKIQALTLLSNIYRAIMEFSADGSIISAAIAKVKHLTEYSQQQFQGDTAPLEFQGNGEDEEEEDLTETKA